MTTRARGRRRACRCPRLRKRPTQEIAALVGGRPELADLDLVGPALVRAAVEGA